MPIVEAWASDSGENPNIGAVEVALEFCDYGFREWVQTQLDLTKAGVNVKEILDKYESLGGEAAVRVKRDVKRVAFDAAAKGVVHLRRVIFKIESEDLGPTQAPEMVSMIEIYKPLAEDIRFVDSMKIHCVQLVQAGEKLCATAEETTLGFDDPHSDTYWKKDLTTTSETKVVLEIAAATIATLSGHQVKQLKSIVDNMREAAQLPNCPALADTLLCCCLVCC
jgi:hypothetical protein